MPNPQPGAPVAEVSFVVDEHDLLAFNMAWLVRSGELRRMTMAAVGLALVPVAGGLALIAFELLWWGVALAGLGAVMALVAPSYVRTRAESETLSRIRSVSTPALLGPRRVVADGSGLTDSGPWDALRLRWSAISDVEVTSSAVYIYYGPVEAIIVPRRAFASRAWLDYFMQVLGHYRQMPPQTLAALEAAALTSGASPTNVPERPVAGAASDRALTGPSEPGPLL